MLATKCNKQCSTLTTRNVRQAIDLAVSKLIFAQPKVPLI